MPNRFSRGKQVDTDPQANFCLEISTHDGPILFPGNQWRRQMVLSSYGSVGFAPVGGYVASAPDIAIVGERGEAWSQHIAIVGHAGVANGWDVAIAGANGQAESSAAGLALVFVDHPGREGKARAGEGGVIAFRISGCDADGGRIIVGVVGENGIKPDTWYTLDENNQIVEAV